MLGYVNIPINQEHYLKVDSTHTLYIEECGNPNGMPVVYLHGGPGGQISEMARRFFDPKFYRIILFDQRGCGKSTPFLSLENNTIHDSVEDIEKIRQYLKIDTWYVFGGSYGTTLAIAYAIKFPHVVRHLILRGVFLGRKSDIDWLMQEGASYFYPEEFMRFKEYIPQAEQGDLVAAYYRRMISEDDIVRDEACYQWSQWESAIVHLVQPSDTLNQPITNSARSIALLEAHYFYHQIFWEDDNYLLANSDRLADIPIDIVHGRHDVDCRPIGAYELKQVCPQANLAFVENGAHTAFDSSMFNALLAIMERIKLQHQKLF